MFNVTMMLLFASLIMNFLTFDLCDSMKFWAAAIF